MPENGGVMRDITGPLRRHWVMVLFVAAYGVVGVATLDGLQHWGDDFALYIAQARALIETGTILDPDYVHNRWIGPRTYPPGLSVLLAPVYAAVGIDLKWLKLPIFLSFCMGLLVLYLVFARRHSRGVALAAATLFATSTYIWSFRQEILSEFLYLLLSFLALYCGCRRAEGRTATNLLYAFLTGVLIALACATRQVGLALLVAIVASNIVWIAGWRDVVRIVCMLAAFFAVQTGVDLLFSSPGHSVAGRSFCMSCAYENARDYYRSLAGVFFAVPYVPTPFRIIDFVMLLLLVPALSGFVALLKDAFRRQPDETPLWLRIPRSVSALDLYGGGMVLALLILPFAVAPRYTLPVLPILYFYFTAGLAAAGNISPPGRWLMPISTVALMTLYAITNVHNARLPQQLLLSGAVTEDTGELYAFIRQNLTNDDLIFVSKPRAFVLFTRRPSTVWNKDASPDGFLEEMKEKGGTHIVIGKAWSGLPTEGWMLTHPTMVRNFDIVFENAQFRVLERKR